MALRNQTKLFLDKDKVLQKSDQEVILSGHTIIASGGSLSILDNFKTGRIIISDNQGKLSWGNNLSDFVTGATNLGSGQQIYRDINDRELRLRSIIGSGDTTVTTSGDTLIVNTLVGETVFGTLDTGNDQTLTTGNTESFSSNISLHKISKTGSYDDLLDTPSIPTVNDNEITVTAGTLLSDGGSFTLNQNSNSTITINHSAITTTTNNTSENIDYGDSFTVITGITVNSGHVTEINSNSITLPTQYQHPTGFTNKPDTPLDNASVISQINVNNEGHVTGTISRELTPANIGAEPTISTKGDILSNSPITATTNNNVLLGGNVTIGLDTTVLDGFYYPLNENPSNYCTSIAHNHNINDSTGNNQFNFGIDDSIRFTGSGITTIGFNTSNKEVIINTPQTDNDAIKKEITQTTHGFSVGDVVGYSSGSYNKPIADGSYDGEVLGVVSNVIDVDNFEITQAGYISGLTGLIAGNTYFLSPDTAGLLTQTKPTTDGYIANSMLMANTTTTGWVLPYPGYIVTTGDTVGVSIIENVGEGVGIFDSKVDETLNLRSIIGSGDTTVSLSGQTIVVNTDAAVSFIALTDTPNAYLNTNYIRSTGSALEYRTPAQVLSDIGAETAFSKGNITQGTGVSLTGILTNRLVNTGDVNIALDTSYADDRYLLESNNLSDLTNTTTARTNLGLGSMATQDTSSYYTTTDSDLRYVEVSGDIMTGNLTVPSLIFSEVTGNIDQTGVGGSLDINPETLIRFGRTTNNNDFAVDILRGDNTTTVNHRFRGVGNSYVSVDNGNFGVGTTSPSEKLDVNGTIKSLSGYKVGTTTVIDSSRNGYFNNLDVDGTGRFTGDLTLISKNVKINSISSGGWARGFGYYDNAGSNLIGQFGAFGNGNILEWLYLGVNYNDTNNVRWYPNGNFYVGGFVGIGTTSPSEKLDVSGTVRTTSTKITDGTINKYEMIYNSTTESLDFNFIG